MRTKSLLSAVALVSAMTFSGSASAQTMFNGVELTPSEFDAVQQRCLQLETAASTESLTEDSASDNGDGATEATPGAGADSTPQIENPPAANEVENAGIPNVDLESITLEQCEAAGIGQ